MTRLPALGARGEGWVAIQGVLLLATAAAGLLGPAWDGVPRLLTSIAGAALIAGGLRLAVRGIRDLRDALTPLPYPRPGAELVETGVYALVRHPIYGGLVIAGVGWGLLTASPPAIGAGLVLLGFFELKSRREEGPGRSGLVGGQFRLKSRREEAWLEVRFPGYAAYRARTRRLIPWVGRVRPG